MIEVVVNSELGTYKQRLNHGHTVHSGYRCTNAYKEATNDKSWSNCPCCGLEPRIWLFNNGRSTACGCGNSQYDHFSVHAESIMSIHARNNGDTSDYDSDELRKNWNEYCSTMVNSCSHWDLRLKGRW